MSALCLAICKYEKKKLNFLSFGFLEMIIVLSIQDCIRIEMK